MGDQPIDEQPPVEEQPPVTEPVVEEQPPVTEPVVEESYVMQPVTENEPAFIITLDQLIESQQALQFKESKTLGLLLAFVQPNPEQLKSRLLQWANLGFRDAFPIFSIDIEVPQKCSDGVTRNKLEYIEYLLGDTLYNKFEILRQKLPGMSLSYSLPNTLVIMHVSKA